MPDRDEWTKLVAGNVPGVATEDVSRIVDLIMIDEKTGVMPNFWHSASRVRGRLETCCCTPCIKARNAQRAHGVTPGRRAAQGSSPAGSRHAGDRSAAFARLSPDPAAEMPEGCVDSLSPVATREISARRKTKT